MTPLESKNMTSTRQSHRSSLRHSPVHSRLFQQAHLKYPDPTPAFGMENEFAFDPNSDANYPSQNARTSMYFPVEPLLIKEAQARVNAIKATETYKQFELDQHLIEEFRKVNIENRVRLEELLKSEKAKLHHPVAGNAGSPTGMGAEQECLTPRCLALKPACNWLDFATNIPEDEQAIAPSSPQGDEDDLTPKAPTNPNGDVDYSWLDFLSELDEEKRQGNRVPDHPRPEQYGFTPRPEIPTKSNKRTIEFAPSPLKPFSKPDGTLSHERPTVKPANKRPGSPWPGKENEKSRLTNKPIQPTEEHSVFQIPAHSRNDYGPSCEDADSLSEIASAVSHSTNTTSNSTNATSKTSSKHLSDASNPFSGLPNLLIPAHPSQKKSPSHEDISSTPRPETPHIHALSPLRPRQTRHSVRTRRPLRHKPSLRSLYWPINHSPSGRYNPIPYPPLHIPDPYVAWPSIPGQFKHRDPHPENAELGPQLPTAARGRPRSNAILGATAPFRPGSPAPKQSKPPSRMWSFVSGKKDVVQVKSGSSECTGGRN